MAESDERLQPGVQVSMPDGEGKYFRTATGVRVAAAGALEVLRGETVVMAIAPGLWRVATYHEPPPAPEPRRWQGVRSLREDLEDDIQDT